MNNTEIIAEFLESHRATKNVTKYRIAIDLEIDQTYLGRVFAGKYDLNTITFLRICKYLSVSKSDMLDLLSKIK